MPINEKYVGSSFDDFLEEEGLTDEVNRRAAKQLIAIRIDEERRKSKLSKVDMAKRMKTSRSALDRILDPRHRTVTLDSLERAARAVGCNLFITVRPMRLNARGNRKFAATASKAASAN